MYQNQVAGIVFLNVTDKSRASNLSFENAFELMPHCFQRRDNGYQNGHDSKSGDPKADFPWVISPEPAFRVVGDHNRDHSGGK